ncbi:sugar ABC transporter substrate-binding protein [Streptomyces somaliensis DSM 40738]|uniref:Sugar ABC transporter substrate-binding protein n=1 Tax=Streptomyces somaliensis (strain ATCC 33201 / DSM 40738 / JCM 12659 / KCTC 9044 / NCTC 11332 / NRRL B-12077 / IP 733) TaxID=1134445 RepID=A0AA44ICC5_STRE0|nr:sugar ABC transporter substrate-binding protein [Streptomyces somaliensis]MCQ0021727.1 sugar ABC transporter substrate-binding protein [Streptomyces somaliensis DSM 40738]NKY13043.1 sugar ABC transporter substrate-binding protein [Streptomyces somaliensis DSM 40738]
MTTGSKRATTLLALLATASLLAGCGGGDGGAGSNDVTVWMYPVIADPKANSAYWKKVEEDFEAANPGTPVTIEEQPWENRDEKLATALGSGKGPDVMLLNPDQVPQYLGNGALRPVDKAVEGIEESFLPNALKALSHDGRLYAVPIYHTVTTTLYNKRLLDRAGIEEPPATWDEIRAAAPRLKRAGVATLDYSASNEATLNLNFYPLLWQAGGSVFSEDGRKAAFNGPEGVAALTFLTDLYKAGAIPRTALTNTNIFADHPLGKQQAAMGFSNTPADADLARRTWGAENVVVGKPLRDAEQVAFGVPGGLGLNADSRNVAGAEKFLAFMAQPERIRSLGEASGFLSPRTDVTVTGDTPYAKRFQEALPFAHPGEPSPVARQLMSLIAPEIQAALTGRKSPKEALDAAAAQADDLLARQR